MNIGVAGAGRMGRLHVGTLTRLPSVNSIVVADTNLARARGLAQEMQIQHVPQPRDLFNSSLDGLVIAAATDAHSDLIIASVEAGIPVFCEKPAAPDAASTRSIIERTSGTNVPVFIGFQRRFDDGFRAAKEAVSSGRLGWLHTIRACTLDPAPPSVEYLAASGGFFRDCSVHDFDAIRWITGNEVVEVYALGTVRGEQFFHDVGDVDTTAALLQLTDGTFAHVSATRYNAHGYDVRFEVLGSLRSISVGLDDRLPIESAEPGVSFPAASPYNFFLERFAAAYVAELTAFVDAVSGVASDPPLCSLADALAATLIAEACEQSRIERRPVRMEELQP